MFQRNQRQITKRISILATIAMNRQLRLGAIILMACALLVGMAAGEPSGIDKSPNSPGAKVLHFPAERSVGKLYVEGESQVDDSSSPVKVCPSRVCLDSDWDFIGPAQGDVVVPADRNI
ncbi:MAG: hypothetical protein ACYSU3_22715, partial [Planctomycetota bacterium]